MSKLSDYRLLSFDVYGTLIDWESGILAAFQPTLNRNGRSFSSKHLLETFHKLEREQQTKSPDMLYSQLLSIVHPQLAAALQLDEPTAEESNQFGNSVGQWPAFPDTVEALRRLSKHYKLLALSNVDRDSFSATNIGPLQDVHFDAIITAQDVGSYKPDLRNFDYMSKHVKAEYGIEKGEILQTAQSQVHDHHPAAEVGIKSVWIVRPGATMGNTTKEVYNWRFDTLGEMVDAIEEETA
jgi:2-haloalkanoic acid dehalogenase type II